MRVGCFLFNLLSYNLLELEMMLCVLMDDAVEMKAFVTETSNRTKKAVNCVSLCIFMSESGQ